MQEKQLGLTNRSDLMSHTAVPCIRVEPNEMAEVKSMQTYFFGFRQEEAKGRKRILLY